MVHEAGSYSILISSECRDLERGVESSLSHLGTVLGLLQLLLSLAELGQVEGGDLLGLLDLLLVGLDLALQLAGQVGHAVLVLPVLVVLELELLDLAVSLLVSLHVLAGVGLDVAELNLKLPQLGLHGSLALSEGGGVVLLGPQLVSQAGRVNHRLLGLLLGALGLVQQVVNLGLHGVQGSLHTALVPGGAGVDGGHLVDSVAGVAQLGLGLPLAALGGVQQSSGLLHLALESVGAAVSEAGLLGHFLADTASLLIAALGLAQLTLVALDGLEGLVVGLVGVVQGDLELVDVRLQLLLDSETLGLGALLGLEGGLERLHCTTMVLASIVELLLLLGNSAVDLLLDLAQLQLSSQHLALLHHLHPLQHGCDQSL